MGSHKLLARCGSLEFMAAPTSPCSFGMYMFCEAVARPHPCHYLHDCATFFAHGPPVHFFALYCAESNFERVRCGEEQGGYLIINVKYSIMSTNTYPTSTMTSRLQISLAIAVFALGVTSLGASLRFTAQTESTALPDLIITATTMPASPTGGDNIRVAVTVRNQGTADAPSTTFSYSLRTDRGDSYFGSIPPVPAGGTVTAYENYIFRGVSMEPAAGSYTYRVCANTTIAIAGTTSIQESNRDNNCFEQPVTVLAGSMADLIVSDITMTPSAPQPTDTIRFAVTLRNQATQRYAEASHALYAGLFLVASGVKVQGGTTYTTVTRLEPGAATVVNFNGGGSNPVLAAGAYRVKMCVDTVYNKVRESDEENNCLEKEFTVGAGAQNTQSSAPASASSRMSTSSIAPVPSSFSSSSSSSSVSLFSSSSSSSSPASVSPANNGLASFKLTPEIIKTAIEANGNNPVCFSRDATWSWKGALPDIRKSYAVPVKEVRSGLRGAPAR